MNKYKILSGTFTENGHKYTAGEVVTTDANLSRYPQRFEKLGGNTKTKEPEIPLPVVDIIDHGRAWFSLRRRGQDADLNESKIRGEDAAIEAVKSLGAELGGIIKEGGNADQ